MKTTIKNVKNLVTRELNKYKKKGYQYVPFSIEVITQTKIITGQEITEQGKYYVFLDDNYKEIIKDFFNEHYLYSNETSNFLSSYQEIMLFRVAKEIIKILEQEDINITDSCIAHLYFKNSYDLEEDLLRGIYKKDPVLIHNVVEEIRKTQPSLVSIEVDFLDKVQIAIDYYVIDYIKQNIQEEIESHMEFDGELLKQIENLEDDYDYKDFE